ncbi:hypothetical protein HYT18_01285 [Candidatus Microgenomates bacterium]|nr:hypothetical protein [Candidatus Microgenomates bacterium]
MVGKPKAQMSNFKSNLNFKKFVICHFNFGIHLLFVILILTLVATPVSAQTSTPSASPLQPTTYNLPPTVSPTSPLYTDLLVHNLFHSFSCLAVGQSVIGQACLTYQLTQNTQGAIQSIPVLSQTNLSGGALGATTSLIGMLYQNPPIRTADYLASVGQGLGIVKEAHAQVVGSGANVLSPILALWQVSRNIAYLVMIIIFVIIGLMVMFRQRINPQTVITAQAALPGLVIGLILITFSYFLAGLISDTAFIGTNLVGAYFSAVKGHSDKPQNLVDEIKSQNVLTIFTPFTRIASFDKVSDALSSIWNDLADPNVCRNCPWEQDPQKVLTALMAFLVAQVIMPFGGMLGGPGQLAAGVISFGGAALLPTQLVTVGLTFVAMVILIYAMFRLLLRLINNYLSIIFLTITAPFQFLAAALPGRQGTATNWILQMLANILAFPAVLAVFYFVAFLLGQDFGPLKVSQINQVQNNGPVTAAYAQGKINVADIETFPLFGGMDLEFIRILLAFGALVALPKIPDLVARALGAVSEAGQLLGQELGGSVAAGRGYAGQFQQGASGLAGQAGRLTNETYYYRDEAGNLKVNPMLSRAGQISKAISNVKGWFGRGPKPTI